MASKKRCVVCGRRQKFGGRMYKYHGKYYCFNHYPVKCNHEFCKTPVPERLYIRGIPFCERHKKEHFQNIDKQDAIEARSAEIMELWEHLEETA